MRDCFEANRTFRNLGGDARFKTCAHHAGNGRQDGVVSNNAGHDVGSGRRVCRIDFRDDRVAAGRFLSSFSGGGRIGGEYRAGSITALDIKPEGLISPDQCDFAGQGQMRCTTVQTVDLHLAFNNLHGGAFVCHRHAECGAFHDSGQIRRLNGKVGRRHLLDLVDDVTEILDDLRESARFCGVRNLDAAAGRHDNEFFTAREHRTTVDTRDHHVSRREPCATQGNFADPALEHIDLSGRFRDRPTRNARHRRVRECQQYGPEAGQNFVHFEAHFARE